MSEVDGGVVTPVAPAVEPAPAPEAPVTQEPADTPQEGEEPAKPEKTYTESEHRKAIQERLGREQKRLERVARAEARADFAERQLEELRRPQQQAQPQSGEPKAEDFQGKAYEEFTKAQIAYAIQQERAKWTQETQAQQQQRIEDERGRALRQKFESAVEKYPDFREAIAAEDLPFNGAILAYIEDSKIGGDVAYHLATNRDEALRIASLKPIQQVKALDALETKLAAAPAPTRTPAPIVPTAGKAPVRKDTFALSLNNSQEWDEFVKRRHKELGRR